MVCDILLWHLSVVEKTNWEITRGIDIHSCLFCVKTSSEEEGRIEVTHSWLVLCVFLMFLTKSNQYNTGSFQWSSTRAVVKTRADPPYTQNTQAWVWQAVIISIIIMIIYFNAVRCHPLYVKSVKSCNVNVVQSFNGHWLKRCCIFSVHLRNEPKDQYWNFWLQIWLPLHP